MHIDANQLINWKSHYPILEPITHLEPVVWFNPNKNQMSELNNLSIDIHDMKQAEQLWERFAPYLEIAFPETKETNGIIESPLREIQSLKESLEFDHGVEVPGSFYLKCDNELKIAGSIKARGGIYEILHFAEKLAIDAGLISKEDHYTAFNDPAFKELFAACSIGVASTGNLGLSIGIISAKLGFHVTVYMSKDAKEWKKDLLREKGAEVIEFAGDFSKAITEGRKQTLAKPNSYFVDDEDSKHLFLGYSVAAFRLKKQLDEKGIIIDAHHPLFVYLPCGVGGSPGGISFGLKQVFGDAVHCFFAEPTHAPAVLLGLITGEMDQVCVQDFGIDNHTEADGLAVGRPSKFATAVSDQLISGIYTLTDKDLYKLTAKLQDTEHISVEPSAAAGLFGPIKIVPSAYSFRNQLNIHNAVHIAWATGGSLVPEKDRKLFYERGKELLD